MPKKNSHIHHEQQSNEFMEYVIKIIWANNRSRLHRLHTVYSVFGWHNECMGVSYVQFRFCKHRNNRDSRFSKLTINSLVFVTSHICMSPDWILSSVKLLFTKFICTIRYDKDGTVFIKQRNNTYKINRLGWSVGNANHCRSKRNDYFTFYFSV